MTLKKLFLTIICVFIIIIIIIIINLWIYY